MSRHLDYRDLEPLERRIVLMRAAGMSEQTIGHFIDVDYMTINAILKRPRCARYLLAVESTFVDDLRDGAKMLDDAIQHTATRAFHIEKEVMETLFLQKESVRAQLGAATTAQDILDRAGRRAPVRTQTEVRHTIDSEALAKVADVLKEHRVIDITPNGGRGVGSESGNRIAEGDAHGRQMDPRGHQETWSAAPAVGCPTGAENTRQETGGGSPEGWKSGPASPTRTDPKGV